MEPSKELRDLVLGLYHDWSSGDPSFVDLLVSSHEGTSLIGTDAVERYTGGRGARAIWRKQVEEVGTHRLVSGDISAWSEGSVGWVVDDPTWVLPEGELAVRFTFVFHREGGKWKIVQVHSSIGVSNMEAFGREITTSLDAIADLIEQERPDLAPVASREGTVTIMFTDIEASTSTNEAMGDDRFLPLLLKHNDIVRTHTQMRDGTIVKSEGDGFMLAFPSARRCVECAVAVQREVAALDETIKVRMGIHTGEPIRHEADFYGRDVAYAARLGSAAVGGEILVSSLVKSLVEPSGSVAFDGPRELELKGFEGPQQIFAVAWSS